MYYYTKVTVVDNEKSDKRVNKANKHYITYGKFTACFPNPDCENSWVQQAVDGSMTDQIRNYRQFVDNEGIYKVEDGLYFRGKPKMLGSVSDSLHFRNVTIYSENKFDNLEILIKKVLDCIS